jgi:hypothetical protein
MAISLASLKTSRRNRPEIVVLYGPAGTGKTTLSAGAPDPVFFWIEQGAGRLEVQGWDIKTYADVIEAIGVLYNEEHDRRTLVVDSLDWLEKLIWEETCSRNGWQNLEEPGYGKGYVAAQRVWEEYLQGITDLRDERGMMIIQIAHAEIKRFESPETEPYDRYGIKLHRLAGAKVSEGADMIGFLNYRVSIAKADGGFGRKITRGVGGGQRVLRLNESPAAMAKQRLGMPDIIELPTVKEVWKQPDELWSHIAQHMPEIPND